MVCWLNYVKLTMAFSDLTSGFAVPDAFPAPHGCPEVHRKIAAALLRILTLDHLKLRRWF